MNPYVLFIGGILLGVLISCSIILRSTPNQPIDFSSSSGSSSGSSGSGVSSSGGLSNQHHQHQSVRPVPTAIAATTTAATDGKVITEYKPITSVNSAAMFEIHTLPAAAQHKTATAATTTATTTANTLANSVDTNVAAAATTTATVVRPRWSPGKQGSLDKFKTAADVATAEFTTVTATATPAAALESPSATTTATAAIKRKPGAALREVGLQKRQELVKAHNLESFIVGNVEKGVSKKQLREAMKLKRKYGTVTNPAAATASITAAGETIVNGNGYHQQAINAATFGEPYIPTYDAAVAANAQPLPNMTLQRAYYEKENLKLHLCNGVFEAYSASYLTTKHHMLAVKSEGYNLSWVNCEMASFIHMRESNGFFNTPHAEGIIMQSLDVLDFSVIHLSAYERSHNKHRFKLWRSKEELKHSWRNIDPVIAAGKQLQLLNDPKLQQQQQQQQQQRVITYLPEAQRTVVVMPFLGGAMGAGHSELNNRYEYLKTCFWSLFEFFPNIVAGVTRQADVDWIRKESGMPFYDVLLLLNLPKSAGLPVGLTQQTKLRLQDKRWDFDFVFFTESDQILISRQLPLMFAHLKKYPGHMILPHRLMPYSSRGINEVHQRSLKERSMQKSDWMQRSCCLPRQNCQERKSWQPLSHTSVPVINYYGLYVPLGNVNFLMEQYRACVLMDYVGPNGYCP